MCFFLLSHGSFGLVDLESKTGYLETLWKHMQFVPLLIILIMCEVKKILIWFADFTLFFKRWATTFTLIQISVLTRTGTYSWIRWLLFWSYWHKWCDSATWLEKEHLNWRMISVLFIVQDKNISCEGRIKPFSAIKFLHYFHYSLT